MKRKVIKIFLLMMFILICWNIKSHAAYPRLEKSESDGKTKGIYAYVYKKKNLFMME